MISLSELRTQLPAAPLYLLQIFLINRDHGRVLNARLAERLGVSRPAVSQAVGRLKKLGLARQDRYGDIQLSGEGRELAMDVLKRHFLLEHLLVSLLGYPWEKSDSEAEILQDTVSQELMDHLVKQLGDPQTCPHGNPMPDSPQEAYILAAPPLDQIPPGSQVEVIRITEEGELVEGMLAFCEARGLAPGIRLSTISADEKGVSCQVGEGPSFLVPSLFTPHLRCYPRESVPSPGG